MLYYPDVDMRIGDNIRIKVFGWELEITTDSDVYETGKEFLKLSLDAIDKVFNFVVYDDEPLEFRKNLIALAGEIGAKVTAAYASRPVFSAAIEHISSDDEYCCRVCADRRAEGRNGFIVFYDKSIGILFRKCERIMEFLAWFFEGISGK